MKKTLIGIYFVVCFFRIHGPLTMSSHSATIRGHSRARLLYKPLSSSLASFRLHEESCQFVCGLHMEGVLFEFDAEVKMSTAPHGENCRENQVNMEKAKEEDNLIAPPTRSSPLSTTVLLLYIESRRGCGHSVCPLCCLFPFASICFSDAAPLDVM